MHVHFWALPERIRGLYDHEERRIYLNLRLTPFERRSTLAHELGHAHYGHDCTSPRGEKQARSYAAGLLIDPEEYERLERINPDKHWLAEEFSVTPQIIHDYEHHFLTRLRGITYSRARMGVGQWAHRSVHA
ncbi:ImmA/IrrE family metallo-endopeptidase [Microbacterium sp. kSW2-24]|nr:ImmA/IrrE family metallo-endopeptidase [Microbacterium galbinum]